MSNHPSDVLEALDLLHRRAERIEYEGSYEEMKAARDTLSAYLDQQAAQVAALSALFCKHCIKMVAIDEGCLRCRLAEGAVMVATRDAAIARMNRGLIAKHGGCWEDPGFLYAAIASIPPDVVMAVGGKTVRVKDWLHDRREMLQLPAVEKETREER